MKITITRNDGKKFDFTAPIGLQVEHDGELILKYGCGLEDYHIQRDEYIKFEVSEQ